MAPCGEDVGAVVSRAVDDDLTLAVMVGIILVGLGVEPRIAAANGPVAQRVT